MATKRSLLAEVARYRQAERLLALGARVPVVLEMTRLSSWFLRKLAREVCGTAPRKGQVPNSELWYLRGRNNLQASMFMALYEQTAALGGRTVDPCDLLIAVYERYASVLRSAGIEPVLTVDRAWWLIKSFRIRNLKLVCCEHCGGRFVRHFGDLERGYACDSCRQAAMAARSAARTAARAERTQA